MNDYKEDLKQRCVDIIKNNITIENVCSLYFLYYRINLNELEEHCLIFAFDNLKEVKKTEAFNKMDRVGNKF